MSFDFPRLDPFSPLCKMQSRVRQFMDLPLELRLMIWKFALRPLGPARPGAHFFSVVNNRRDGSKATKISTLCAGISNECCPGFHLAAPNLDSSNGSHSWTRRNPSAYTWDFGMWAACRESRQVIRAHYNTACLTRKLKYGHTMKRTYAETSVPLILPDNKENWRFLFHPKQDLVCLQAFDPSTTHWWVDLDRKQICFGNHASNFVYIPSLFSFGHVAIAYDPSWNGIAENMGKHTFRRLYKEQSARGFFIRTLAILDDDARCYGHNVKGRAFWLIDYNLKRVRLPKKDRKDRKVFYGNGQTFTEVDKSLSRCNFSSGEHSSALDFLTNLDILLDEDYPSHCMRHRKGATICSLCRNPLYRLTPYQIHRHVRVLMCEEEST
ncbi:hypothetical protein TrVFT333_006065 [Trichoderma virens FT-333]|nr:hypothetical protein TrVFT333_006065 [Trichoderma virens FT-333]